MKKDNVIGILGVSEDITEQINNQNKEKHKKNYLFNNQN